MAIVKAENARKDIPLVSVITVCYNHSKYVEETLDSILNQTYENIELIIIDSNSPDNSVEVIEKWIEKNGVESTFIKRTSPFNASQNFTKGVEISSGEYFKPIACDDYLDSNYCTLTIDVFRKNNDDVSVVFTDSFVVDEMSTVKSESYITRNNIPIDLLNYQNQFIWFLNNLYATQGAMINKEKAVSVGLYDSNVILEDLDMWLKLLRISSFRFINSSLAYYRKHYSSNHISISKDLQENKDKFLKNKLYILNKYVNEDTFKKEVRLTFIQELNRLKYCKEEAFSAFSYVNFKPSINEFIAIIFVILSPRYDLSKRFIKLIC